MKGARERGGWKIEQERSTGRRSASAAGHAREPGATNVMGKAGIAHCPAPVGRTEGTVDGGGAGFPEHRAPEHGVGRSCGDSSQGEGIAPDRPSSSRWANSPFDRDREVT